MRRPERRLARIPSAALSDALGRLGTMNAAIKPMTSARRITGLARTVRCVPGITSRSSRAWRRLARARCWSWMAAA